MKYKDGDIVCLNDGRTVYIFAVDKSNKEYQVTETEDNDALFFITEDEILMKLT